MSYEDFTTFTEVDPNSHLTVNANQIDCVNLARNEDAYVYKDFGVDHFNTINIEFDGYLTNSGDEYALMGIGFGNEIDDMANIAGTDFFLILQEWTSNIRFERDWFSSQEGVGKTYNAWYYFKIERNADSDSATCKIYSDSARTNLLNTLTITGLSTTKFRYLFACASGNTGHTYGCNNKIKNLEIIGEAIFVPFPRLSGRNGGIGTHLQGGIGR